ncbi:MAG: polysaccharide deacetylase family protein, partial [Chloroflexota bacterium]
FISIHFNGYDDPSVRGTETYYCRVRPFAKESQRLAELVQKGIISRLKAAGAATVDRGIKDDASIGARYGYQHSFLLGPELERPSQMPGVIGEALFLTNQEDTRLVRDPNILDAIAAGYSDAVDNYFQERMRPTPTTQPLSAVLGGIWRGPSGNSQVALTFDAGASAKPTPKILAVLKAHGVQTTMFITGQWARENPDLLRQMIADGHELGNHSYSHPYLSKMTRRDIEDELERARRQVEAITGTSMAPYFRPPFGEQTKDIIDMASSLGYTTVYWTLDSGDWLEGATSASVKRRVLDGVSDGAIVVMHLGSQATAEALEDILKALSEKGLLPVSLSQLLAP